MKRLSKLFLLLLLVASMFVPSFGTALVAFADAPIASVGAQITITQMPTKGQIGTSIVLPKGESTDGTVTITVKDPKGAAVSLTDASPLTYSFNPALTGTYKVQYAVVSADEGVLASTYSKQYEIVVAGDKPVFNFETNSNVILPEVTNYNNLIVIPYPEVTASNGEEVALADVANDIIITVKDPQGQTITLGETTIGDVTYKTFTPQAAAGEGVYTIDYYYVETADLNARKVFEMEVDSSFSADDVKLSYTLEGSMPESAVLGNEITLPNAITRNQNAGNALIRTYIDVAVKFVNPDGDDVVYEVEDFKFTPIHEGNYEVVYSVYNYDALQSEEALAEYTYTIKNVKDTEAPNVMPEEFMDDAEYEFENADFNIPSNVAVGTTVYFPAIHATDNFSLSSNLTYRRSIVNENNTITDLDNETNNQYGYFEQVPYTFQTEGTYTVKYFAQDQAGRTKEVSYVLKVVDGFVDNVKPVITMPNIPNYAKVGDTVKFLKPTAIDYESATSKNTVDTRVEVKTYFYVGDNSGVAVQIFEDEEDSNYLSFVIPHSITEDYIHILVEAKDDGMNNSSQVNVQTSEKRINLLDITDGNAPMFVGDEPTITAKNQNTLVDLPTVKFSDDNPTFVAVSVDVKDPSGNKVAVSGLQLSYELDSGNPNDDDGIKVTAGKFNAIMAGNYRITYTATDVANNSYVISFTQYINDTQAPTFEVSGIRTKVEVGETITIPYATIMDNGQPIENEALTTIVFLDSPAYEFNLTTYEFTALEEGIYSFKYLAEDESGNTSESAVYSFTASDSIDPTITLNDEVPFPATHPLTRPSENDPYNAISIPDFVAYDEFNGIREFSVIVKNPSGSVILEAKNGETATGGAYSFVPTKDGSYTVTYSATDLAGNVTTLVRTVRVGDTASPVLTIGNTTANKPQNQDLNATITLDLTEITITDNKDGDITTTDITTTGLNKFTVTLTAPDGTTVNHITDQPYSYKLTQSGEYTLSYTVRDEAGNTKLETHVFQVSAEESGLNTVTETLAIVLIIIAVLTLAGVVVYFIRSREIVED
jgi:hypothetical protein